MITDNEWNNIAGKAFPNRSAKAPPFLWTRVLATIQAQETRQGAWWMQWRWMTRFTVAMGLLVTVGTIYLFQYAALPLEVALDGRSNQHQALQIASADIATTNDSAVLVLGLDS